MWHAWVPAMHVRHPPFWSQPLVSTLYNVGPVNPGLGPAPPRGLLDRGQPPPLAGLPGLGVQAIARGGAAPNLPLGGQVGARLRVCPATCAVP